MVAYENIAIALLVGALIMQTCRAQSAETLTRHDLFAAAALAGILAADGGPYQDVVHIRYKYPWSAQPAGVSISKYAPCYVQAAHEYADLMVAKENNK